MWGLIYYAFLVYVSAEPTKPSLEIHVELSPAGSFVAKSDAITAHGARRDENGVIRADRIELKLETLKTGIGLRDDHMTKKYFEVSKYPLAVLTNLVAEKGKFKANLNIRNRDKPIEGNYSITAENGTAEFKCALSDFSIPEARYMGVGVEDEVTVKISGPLPLTSPVTPPAIAEKPSQPTAPAPSAPIPSKELN